LDEGETYVATDWNQKVRAIAEREYVQPARKTHTRIVIQQGELYDKAVKLGLRPGNANQIGSSLESSKFWDDLGLEMISPKGQSRARTTVYEFRFRDEQADHCPKPDQEPQYAVEVETPSQRAFRLTERVRGLLKDEIAAFGGTEAFMRWVRSDEEDAA
jgi:hypothetical protein